ncbi:hypothetical protein SGGMMB4_02157 [Sodalis glossinidius str. 'morsitans']|uniref:Uncharacterized protein n=1 Tax=Sodalis glossinidius (strain morsitans) TaxID=343509 RepID=A0A193QI12_SODGM|nr:hypothetical protein SGGMMB4_02157 [Sodalis glossinidius str. 'morsitans']
MRGGKRGVHALTCPSKVDIGPQQIASAVQHPTVSDIIDTFIQQIINPGLQLQLFRQPLAGAQIDKGVGRPPFAHTGASEISRTLAAMVDPKPAGDIGGRLPVKRGVDHMFWNFVQWLAAEFAAPLFGFSEGITEGQRPRRRPCR